MKLKCHQCPERAVFHITEVDDGGQYSEVHLCPKCAHHYLNATPEQSVTSAALAEVPEKPKAEVSVGLPSSPLETDIECSVCGMTFAEFRSSGRLGCPHDYDAFREHLMPLMETIHGNTRHVGKVPGRLPADTRVQTELIKLRQELRQAIATEDYERAAELRDQIDRLRGDHAE
ncbi:UvrB/uvrC motif protein [Planctomycetes bacterium Pan216]|uniref:UvrB/uvrC motif protein n=1 Tax=Kolteria novifilia TaxID=2527975 RepID=A0A518B2Y4_9BACT|nr:UvrB/uvrC motif protein [Planctomycetes bacterium Pan216]